LPQITNIDEFLKTTTSAKYVTPIPRIKQQWGPTCGLYALSEVIGKQSGGAVLIPACKHDNPDYQGDSLRYLAKRIGFTDIGPMYDSLYLVTLARSQHMAASIVRVSIDTFQGKVEENIDAGNMLLVCFDVAESGGGPDRKKGERAHWCIVFGYFVENDVHHVLSNQWEKHYRWKTSDLAASCNQLERDPRGVYVKWRLDAETVKKFNLLKTYGLHGKDPANVNLWDLGETKKDHFTMKVRQLNPKPRSLAGVRNRLVAIRPKT